MLFKRRINSREFLNQIVIELAYNIQIVTGAMVISGICVPEVGKRYPRSKAEGNISQLREHNFH